MGAMMDGESSDGTPERQKEDALRAASDAYSQLIRATADICSPRYHYYCDDIKAKLPDDEIVVVANTRKVPIKDNALFKTGSATGALEARAVEDRGPDAVQFVPIKGRSREEAISTWKEGIRTDLQQIERHFPEARYVCLSEFGFPFALDYKEAMEIPPDLDRDWEWLKEANIISSRFVCMGSAHRSFFRSASSEDVQYENIAVVFPYGKKRSKHPNKIFEQKLASLPEQSKIDGVEFANQFGERGITATFKSDRYAATRRADLSGPKAASIDRLKVRFAKDAFDFYDSTADQAHPPVYIRKKSPARKLGEYIDANGKIELDVFVTELGVVAVLICYDAFDPTIFLSAVRMYLESLERNGGFVHQAIDIFFIPAFNRSQKFVDMCQTLSRETNSIVVYVSGDDRCEVKSNVFVCGQSCELWAEKMSDDDEASRYYKRESVPGHDHLHVHRINIEVVTAAMRHSRMHASPSIRRAMIIAPKRLGADVL
jgi:hypothetical protein